MNRPAYDHRSPTERTAEEVALWERRMRVCGRWLAIVSLSTMQRWALQSSAWLLAAADGWCGFSVCGAESSCLRDLARVV